MYRVLIGRFTGSPALQALYRVPLAREHDELERERCTWEMCSLARVEMSCDLFHTNCKCMTHKRGKLFLN